MIVRRIFINTSDIQKLYGVSPRKAQYLLDCVRKDVMKKCDRRTDVTFMEYFQYYNIPIIFLKIASPELANNLEDFMNVND